MGGPQVKGPIMIDYVKRPKGILAIATQAPAEHRRGGTPRLNSFGPSSGRRGPKVSLVKAYV